MSAFSARVEYSGLAVRKTVEDPKHLGTGPRRQGFCAQPGPAETSANTAASRGQPANGQTRNSQIGQALGAKSFSASSIRGAIQCYLACAVLFIFYSRFFDLFLSQYKIPAITLGLSALATLFSGHLWQSLHSRISKLLILFTGVLMVSSMFSIWRGGSLEVVIGWAKSLLIYFLIVSLIQDWKQSWKLVRNMAWSIGVLSVLSYIYGSGESGRFLFAEGKLMNPNDLAQVLLLGLPFLLMLFWCSAMFAPSRLISLALIGVLGVTLLRTGSRGAMISAAISLLVLMATGTSKVKMLTALALATVLAWGALALSPALRARYLTFFDSTIDDTSEQTAQMSQIAVDSAVDRRELLMESVKFTLLHPILGVGPGMFAEARERDAAEQGRHAAFLLTHNTYTQVSSECGIPALVIFVAIVISIYRTATKIHRLSSRRPEPDLKAVAAAAMALKYSLLAYATTSFFSSVAYQALLPTLAGLVVALEHSVAPRLAAPAK